MKAKLPPMFPRVVVADEVRDSARRARVFGCLASLDECQVLEEVRRYLEVERGALARQSATLPVEVKDAATFALRVFGAVESVAAGAGMWQAMRKAKAGNVGPMEAQILAGLQEVMDLAFEAQSAFAGESRVLVAGIGGCDLAPLARLWATSGLEASVNLGDEVRLAVRGVVENPFARFAPAKPKGSRRQQTGRQMPERPNALESDDVAILRAMEAGAVGKAVAPKTADFGPMYSESHVRKRRSDLQKWGLTTTGLDATMTDKGRLWLSELPTAHDRKRPT